MYMKNLKRALSSSHTLNPYACAGFTTKITTPYFITTKTIDATVVPYLHVEHPSPPVQRLWIRLSQ